MKKELDEQLCKEFPNLYSDRHKSIQMTCMSWGFDIANGWFQIIYDLSAKLEDLILKYKKEHKDEMYCRYCTRKEKDHTDYYTFTPDGNTSIPIQDIVQYTSTNPIDSKNLFECKDFDPSFPRASQVKEKFGGLRFYMTSSTDEMEKLISEAEALCDVFCEDCGKAGEICSDGGWYRTLCEDCVNRYNKGFDDGFGFRVRSYIQCSKLKEKIDNGNQEEESSEENNKKENTGQEES